MKILYYDCFSGISGDMNLGAMLDLGVDQSYLISELAKLKVSNEYEIVVKKGQKLGITGTKVDVLLKDQGHHHHDHDKKNHVHKDHHHGKHRNLSDIEEIINSSVLNKQVKENSIRMFLEVAKAEAKVHGKALNEVHFHEVGATDSIVDIVGAAICLDYLKVDKIISSSVQVGGGFVKCAHGIMPVPAPATAEILANIPVKSGLVQFETTTPTGAAILAANVTEFSDNTAFTITKTGYGLGTRDMEIPNLLRVYLAEESQNIVKKQYILETNIDDMNPEMYSYVEERLFSVGALDVYKTPIIMKKGRPAIKLSILVDSKCEEQVKKIIFIETTSLGLRKFEVEKVMLERIFEQVETKYGTVSIKKAFLDGKVIKYKAEFEDCQKLALEHKISLDCIYKEVDRVVAIHVPT